VANTDKRYILKFIEATVLNDESRPNSYLKVFNKISSKYDKVVMERNTQDTV
jgi:hypothetical protein